RRRQRRDRGEPRRSAGPSRRRAVTSRDEIDVTGQAAPISHYAHAVRAEGPLLFVSGVVPVDEQGRLVGGDDVVEQARAVFRNLCAVLAAGGSRFVEVVTWCGWLPDVGDRPVSKPVRAEGLGLAR